MKKLIANYKVDGVESGTVEELVAWLKDKTLVAIDTETVKEGNSSIKMDTHDMKVIMFQIGDKYTQ